VDWKSASGQTQNSSTRKKSTHRDEEMHRNPVNAEAIRVDTRVDKLTFVRRSKRVVHALPENKNSENPDCPNCQSWVEAKFWLEKASHPAQDSAGA
jgi:hypothetical protein